MRLAGRVHHRAVPHLQGPRHEEDGQDLYDRHRRPPFGTEGDGDQVRCDRNQDDQHGEHHPGHQHQPVQPDLRYALALTAHSRERRVDHSREGGREQDRGEHHDRHREVPDAERVYPDERSDQERGDQRLKREQHGGPGQRHGEPREGSEGGAGELEGRPPACRHDEEGGHRSRQDNLLQNERPGAGAEIGGAHRAGHRDQRGGHRRALDHAEAHRSRQEGIAGGTERDQEERQPARDQQGCHLRFAESQRRRVCGQRGECRSDRPRSEGRPAGGRRPALGYGLRLYERRAEAEVTEGHRERRQRDGESSDAVVGRRQQPGEDDHPREPDGLDRHLRADRPDGTALQRASDVLRRDVRQGLRDQGAPRGPDSPGPQRAPSGGEGGPSSIALGDDALLCRRPADAQRRIVPAHSASRLRHVVM